MKKIGMVSLGCPKNTVDTELALGDLLKNGYQWTATHEEADVLIVNTCGFIESSKKESIDAIFEMAQMKTDGKCSKLVVTGCLSQRYGKELIHEIPEIDLLMGVDGYPQLKNLLEKESLNSDEDRKPTIIPEYFESYGQRELITPFYSTYLKIGEGCSFKCAFCYIPKIRGAFRSRTIESIFEETTALTQKGVREFNLVSQVTTLYGNDLGLKNGLVQLLRELVKVKDVDWLRLLYCYPTLINDDLLECVRDEEKVCDYIDVPLQHIDNDMLKLMKRQETETLVRDMIENCRNKIPDIALRTTFIVGFPGETEKSFQKLAKFLDGAEFDHVGVFTYSDEEGTTAFDYPDKVPPEIAEERKNELMRIQKEISFRKNQKKIGKTYPILVEGLEEESFLLTGRASFQAPEIDGQIIIEESEVLPGQIVQMTIDRAFEYDLVAKVMETKSVS
jgi:ribosomal protein S12 methylthiotransferase